MLERRPASDPNSPPPRVARDQLKKQNKAEQKSDLTPGDGFLPLSFFAFAVLLSSFASLPSQRNVRNLLRFFSHPRNGGCFSDRLRRLKSPRLSVFGTEARELNERRQQQQQQSGWGGKANRTGSVCIGIALGARGPRRSTHDAQLCYTGTQLARSVVARCLFSARGSACLCPPPSALPIGDGARAHSAQHD